MSGMFLKVYFDKIIISNAVSFKNKNANLDRVSDNRKYRSWGLRPGNIIQDQLSLNNSSQN